MKKDFERVNSAMERGLFTEDMIVDAAERQMFGTDNLGFCLECGNEQDGCEPDARNYECEACGVRAVFGAAEIAMTI